MRRGKAAAIYNQTVFAIKVVALSVGTIRAGMSLCIKIDAGIGHFLVGSPIQFCCIKYARNPP